MPFKVPLKVSNSLCVSTGQVLKNLSTFTNKFKFTLTVKLSIEKRASPKSVRGAREMDRGTNREKGRISPLLDIPKQNRVLMFKIFTINRVLKLAGLEEG